MTDRPPPLPGVGPDLDTELAAWANDPAWPQLVTAFGGDAEDLPGPTAQRLAWLDTFSDRWDARLGGLERDQTAELRITESQDILIRQVATHFGMRTARPPRFSDYDHVLALGGLIRACFIRPAYAAELLSTSTVSSNSFIALGGHRPFSESEHALARQMNLSGVDSEYTALDAGVRAAFHLDQPTEVEGEVSDSPGGSWTVHKYGGDGALAVTVAAAPSSQPQRRRANTADAYVWMARNLTHLRPGQRLLAVTTPIYVPAQHAAAVATLGVPYGVTVDTVGNDPGSIDARWAQSFSATRYLMEFRSTIRAMRRLAGV